MKKNMGSTDRVIRTLVALAIGVLIVGGPLNGTLAVILGLLAVVFLATSAMGFCPLYASFKISTMKRSS